MLRPGQYGYYAYWGIEDALKKTEKKEYRFHNLIKFTIRLAIFLKTERIVSVGKSRLAEIVAETLGISYCELNNNGNFNFRKADLLILDKQVLNKTLIQKAVEEEVAVFSLDPDSEIRNILEKPLSHGLLFSGIKRILLIPRSEMAYLSYPIDFFS